MLSILFALAIIGTGIYTMFNPVLIPQPFMDGLEVFFEGLLYWDGIIPTLAMLKVATFVFLILLLKMMWKIVMGGIAMLSGAGKPEID